MLDTGLKSQYSCRVFIHGIVFLFCVFYLLQDLDFVYSKKIISQKVWMMGKTSKTTFQLISVDSRV